MAPICVIDIGGTNTRCGLYQCGRLISPPDRKHPTPSYRAYGMTKGTEKIVDEIQDRLIETIVRLCRQKLPQRGTPVKMLAIGFPGPVTDDGMIRESCVIFGRRLRRPFDLRSTLKREFQGDPSAPEEILVTNDMTAAAWRYSDSGFSPFCLITVSSGVGNKIFANNQVMIGPDGLAGEIGHIEVPTGDDPIPCDCGWGEDHVGMISSGRGIEHFAEKFANGRWAREFYDSKLGRKAGGNAAALKGKNEWIARYADARDPFARKVIDFCTQPLAEVICCLAAALYIRKFILIGGFALNCDYYRTALVRNVQRRGIYNFAAREIQNMIIVGHRDDHHTLIGLGKMCEHRDRTGAHRL
jgi:predicted NBD/HSP70 family sugar kinase